MSDPGKRRGTDQPLTEHDVAERANKAMLRAWRILLDVRQDPALFEEVRASRYLSNVGDELAKELAEWGWPYGPEPAAAEPVEIPVVHDEIEVDPATLSAAHAQGAYEGPETRDRTCGSTRYATQKSCSPEGPIHDVVVVTHTGKEMVRTAACFVHGLAEVDRHYASATIAHAELVDAGKPSAYAKPQPPKETHP